MVNEAMAAGLPVLVSRYAAACRDSASAACRVPCSTCWMQP